jgi:hypothetical protein
MVLLKWPIAILISGMLLVGSVVLPPVQEIATSEPTIPPIWISPTPDETGAISVVVQPGESLWTIAARAGMSLPDLLALNNLTEQSVINPGDVLVIGYVTPEATPVTPEAGSPTATRPPPTPRPTEPPPEAAICLTAFNDLDRDGIHDAEESLRSGVAFTIYNSQAVVANYITDGISEPKCLEGIAPGEYRVTRSVVSGEVLTTAGDWALNVSADSRLYQSFGSFIGDSGEIVPGNTPTVTGQPATGPAPTPTAAPGSAVSTPLPMDEDRAGSSIGGWSLAGVISLFLGGLTLLIAVLILLLRQGRGRQPATEKTDSGRRFKNLDDLD